MTVYSPGPVSARLAVDRWHFQHGPIDLIIGVDAAESVRESCIAQCWDEFQKVLAPLVAELPALRCPASYTLRVRGAVAQRMLAACAPFAQERFITPMAAVAGSVADHLVSAFQRSGIHRAFINNGGDIAVHLAPGSHYRVGVWSIDLDGAFVVDNSMPVRGIATSGWRGRSFSLGIADSVTVLAHDAAAADAAATLIANSVDCGFPGIQRAPAETLKDDSDLGERLVTVNVPTLSPAARSAALMRGRLEAERWRDRGLIYAASLSLQGEVEVLMPHDAATDNPQTRATA